MDHNNIQKQFATSEMSNFKPHDYIITPINKPSPIVAGAFIASSICSSLCMVIIFGICLISLIYGASLQSENLGTSWILFTICICVISFLCIWSCVDQ